MSVKECADLLLHIINSVLDLSKIEAGRLEVETIPFSVRKMVSSTLRMMQARAQAHNLQLLWHIESGVPDRVVGDPGKLQQCLLNLGMHFHSCFVVYCSCH
jgi:signal transduction histidine kinase